MLHILQNMQFRLQTYSVFFCGELKTFSSFLLEERIRKNREEWREHHTRKLETSINIH